jgi:hypothetical protein
MRDQNTPFYRPTAELWAAMACMALSGMGIERKAQEAARKAAVEEEREACAKIADDYPLKEWEDQYKFEIARRIRARSANPP